MADVLDTSGYTGSAVLYRHALSGCGFTEGVRYVADTASAYWLLDAILSYRFDPTAAREEFQVWTLTTRADHTATLVMTNGNEHRPIVTQHIEFTDFPQETMVMWFANKTLYLPSEH